MILKRTLLLTSLMLTGCGDESAATNEADEAMLQAAMNDSPFMTPGVEPTFVPAAEASLAEDDDVIGVVVDGEARAYPVSYLSGMTTHVVNDLIGQTPITVTYCDRTDCTRVFTDSSKQSELDVGTGGFANDEMQITLGDSMYAQTASDIPLEDAEFLVMPWSEWKQQHPETRVLVSEGGSPDAEVGPAMPTGPVAPAGPTP
jgi:hypothetical protein